MMVIKGFFCWNQQFFSFFSFSFSFQLTRVWSFTFVRYSNTIFFIFLMIYIKKKSERKIHIHMKRTVKNILERLWRSFKHSDKKETEKEYFNFEKRKIIFYLLTFKYLKTKKKVWAVYLIYSKMNSESLYNN